MRGPGKLYAILDTALLRRVVSDDELAAAVEDCAAALLSSGVETLQLRAKDIAPRRTLALVAAVKAIADSSHRQSDSRSYEKKSVCQLILNDRPDLALLAAFDGCHLGQDDLSIAGARKILPRPKLLGSSTHTQQQLEAANQCDADYIALGPIFATTSKQDPDPVVGLDELARLRTLTAKPLVAIGGITRNNARNVLEAGADSVAVIGDLYRDVTSARDLAQTVARNVADILDAIR